MSGISMSCRPFLGFRQASLQLSEADRWQPLLQCDTGRIMNFLVHIGSYLLIVFTTVELL